MTNLAECIERGDLNAEIALVIASNDRCKGIERARGLRLNVRVLRRKQYDSVEAFSHDVFGEIRAERCDLVCLGGFLSLLRIPDDFFGKVMNVHPALLPSFGGKGYFGHRVHEAVLASGCKVSGCTVHFADNEYDHGPIIAQQCVPVEEDDTPDTLAERVMAVERQVYPRAVRWFADQRLHIDGKRVQLSG